MENIENKTTEELRALAEKALPDTDKLVILKTLSVRCSDNGELFLTYNSAMFKLAESINNYYYMATAMNHAGSYYFNIADFNKALQCLNAGIAYAEKASLTEYLPRLRNKLGLLYTEIGEYQRALGLFQQCISETKQNGRNAYIWEYTGSMAGIYARTGEYGQAITLYQQAIAINPSNTEAAINFYPEIAHVYKAIGDYAQALEWVKKGLGKAREANQPFYIAYCQLNLAEIELAANNGSKNIIEIESLLLEAFNYANEANNTGLLKLIFMRQAQLYEYAKEWEQATHCYRRYIEAEKKITASEARRNVAVSEVKQQLETMEKVNAVTEQILCNILPKRIAERIKNGENEITEQFENVTILFADIVNFTQWSARMDPARLVMHLNKIFTKFDEVAMAKGVEKIKTIGDAYMCVAGAPSPFANHAIRAAETALDMMDAVKALYPTGEIGLRIGLHSGPVVAGILGKNKYSYDLWGDTVNTASRMESHGANGKIHVTEHLKNLISNEYRFEERGLIPVKGKGELRTWYLTGRI